MLPFLYNFESMDIFFFFKHFIDSNPVYSGLASARVGTYLLTFGGIKLIFCRIKIDK